MLPHNSTYISLDSTTRVVSIYLPTYTHTHVRQAHIYVNVESEVCAKEFLKQDTKRITYDKKIDTFDSIKIMNLFFQSLH